MYYIYLIRNMKTRETYIGYTADLRKRFQDHQDKHPELIYYEAYKAKQDAQERERKLKQRGQSVRWLKGRLGYSLRK